MKEQFQYLHFIEEWYNDGVSTLSIDTTSNKEIFITLQSNSRVYILKQDITTRKAQMVLPLIIGLLQQHHLTLENIEEITVNPGPGSYTGVRVGVSIANALAYALQIPVNGISYKDNTSLVEPIYTA